jgi:hypothetical protein
VGAEEAGEADVAAGERVDDVGGRLGGRDVHGDLLGVGLDLLERAGERLAVVHEVRAARVGLVLARPRQRELA